jgi:hypothetical protein
MSSTRYKTTYCTEEEYGQTKEYNLYANYNNSSDIVTFYDENFEPILIVQDCVSNNLMEALIRIWNHNDENDLGVQKWTKEDNEKYNQIKNKYNINL